MTDSHARLIALVQQWRKAADDFGANPFSDAHCLRLVAGQLEALIPDLALPLPQRVYLAASFVLGGWRGSATTGQELITALVEGLEQSPVAEVTIRLADTFDTHPTDLALQGEAGSPQHEQEDQSRVAPSVPAPRRQDLPQRSRRGAVIADHEVKTSEKIDKRGRRYMELPAGVGRYETKPERIYLHESRSPDGIIKRGSDLEAPNGGRDVRCMPDAVSSTSLQGQAREGSVLLGSVREHPSRGEPEGRPDGLRTARQSEPFQGADARSGGTPLPAVRQDRGGERPQARRSSDNSIDSGRKVHAGERRSAVPDLPRNARALGADSVAGLEPADSHYQQRAEHAEVQVATLDMKWAAASEFIRDVIEAVGLPQPPLEGVVNLPGLLLQVVGQIEESKAQVATLQHSLYTASTAFDRQYVELSETRLRADKAEAELATLQAQIAQQEPK